MIKCLLVVTLIAACGAGVTEQPSSVPRRDINAVLRDHDRQLLAVPNVTGVYVGLMQGTKEPCLKVMLKHQPTRNDKSIPDRIEGYRVVREVSGEIRPLKE